jgi:predicted lipid-binding transport protein (Tim44 family)
MAALTATVIMLRVTRKFGTGILASGFKAISFGVLFIALGIMVDTVQSYLQVEGFTGVQQFITIILIIKLILFVIGTYIIVIGSKRTGDKLESLTK